MDTLEHVPLSELTTLRVGGPARRMARADTADEVIEIIAAADAIGEPVLVIAGGSNLLIADGGFDGLALRIAVNGIEVSQQGHRTRVDVGAGERWDDVVGFCVSHALAGVECLSGIPGWTGATPSPLALPIRYSELARALDAAPGSRPALGDVREAVLRLRRRKGMVLDPEDPDSVSAGSFFVNPILTTAAFADLQRRVAARFGDDVSIPEWPDADGSVKTSAAWLIERAGFHRGYGDGRAGISSKHTLAIINRGGATSGELVALAREMRDGVREAFGVTLLPEPTLVGISL